MATLRVHANTTNTWHASYPAEDTQHLGQVYFRTRGKSNFTLWMVFCNWIECTVIICNVLDSFVFFFQLLSVAGQPPKKKTKKQFNCGVFRKKDTYMFFIFLGSFDPFDITNHSMPFGPFPRRSAWRFNMMCARRTEASDARPLHSLHFRPCGHGSCPWSRRRCITTSISDLDVT